MGKNSNQLCPECNHPMHKAGFVWSGHRKIQRFRCSKCGRTSIKHISTTHKPALVPSPNIPEPKPIISPTPDTDTVKLTISKVQCQRCGHKWIPRVENPKTCALCHSPYWNTPSSSTPLNNIRKKCIRCNDPIAPTNKSGYCQRCKSFLKYQKASHKPKKVCIKCGKPIGFSSQTGYCTKCRASLFHSLKVQRDGNGYNGETKAHTSLKSLAYEYLLSLGCSDIRTEVIFGKPPYKVIIDLVGTKDNKYIAVECGGSTLNKLIKATQFIDFIYILPFHETKPFLWHEHMDTCPRCGHIMGDLRSDNYILPQNEEKIISPSKIE